MGKHAFLILAHNNFEILIRLLMLLDDERNDIYLHIDKKVKQFNWLKYKNLIKKSDLYFVDRVDVRWGDVSTIQAVYILLKSAFNNQRYSFYHLLSGIDLPIKSQDYIHDFFKKHAIYEFVGFSNLSGFEERVRNIHILPRYQRTSNVYINRILRIIRSLFIQLQNLFNYDHFPFPDKLMMDPLWVSITHNLVDLLLTKEDFVLKQFNYSSCGDELFIQTIVANSPFNNQVYNKNEGDDYDSCLRMVDWHRGNPYIFRSEDFEMLISSNKLFARKFDYDIDIVEKLYNHLSMSNRGSIL